MRATSELATGGRHGEARQRWDEWKRRTELSERQLAERQWTLGDQRRLEQEVERRRGRGRGRGSRARRALGRLGRILWVAWCSELEELRQLEERLVERGQIRAASDRPWHDVTRLDAGGARRANRRSGRAHAKSRRFGERVVAGLGERIVGRISRPEALIAAGDEAGGGGGGSGRARPLGRVCLSAGGTPPARRSPCRIMTTAAAGAATRVSSAAVSSVEYR